MSGRLLQDVTDLHSRPISAVLFFRPLQYLITGARDGASKYIMTYPVLILSQLKSGHHHGICIVLLLVISLQ